MSAPFKVGDWVTWGDQSTAWKVKSVGPYLIETDGGPFLGLLPGNIRRLHESKPRRKLTLSRGLAWFPLNLGISKTSGGLFEIYQFGEGRVVAVGPTLLKAIIAARKALGVKS